MIVARISKMRCNAFVFRFIMIVFSGKELEIALYCLFVFLFLPFFGWKELKNALQCIFFVLFALPPFFQRIESEYFHFFIWQICDGSLDLKLGNKMTGCVMTEILALFIILELVNYHNDDWCYFEYVSRCCLLLVFPGDERHNVLMYLHCVNEGWELSCLWGCPSLESICY